MPGGIGQIRSLKYRSLFFLKKKKKKKKDRKESMNTKI